MFKSKRVKKDRVDLISIYHVSGYQVSNHVHQTVCSLQLMEESVELIKSQLSKHRFLFIPLIQKLHLDKNHAFTTVSAHTVSRSDSKLVIEVDKLTVVDLLEQIF